MKEDIRVALNALATFHMSCGRFAEAQRIFISTLEYCTSPQHRLEYSQKLSVCALELRAWSLAQGQATKSRNYAQHISPAARQRVNAQADATHGIVCLKKGKYERAAHYFLDVTTNIGASYTEVAAMEDIALYGSLCAVASFSRASLKTAALRRESFHEIMQTVPGVREMISCVVETKYGEALEILQALEPWAVNDRYLSDCWDELKGKILEKIICVYFTPFVSCDLNSMALELRMPLEDLEAQCAKLIVAGKLAARIDSHRKIMQRRSTDQRTQTFSKALQIGDSYQQRMQAIIFALSVKMHGITAKCSKEDQSRGVSIASLRPKVVSGQSQDAADVHILDG